MMNKPVCILYTVIFVCAITSAVSDVLHPLLTKSRRTKNIQLQYPSASSSSIKRYRSLQEEEEGGICKVENHTLLSQSLILRSSYGNIFSITTEKEDSEEYTYDGETITIKSLSLRMANFRPELNTHFEVWLYTGPPGAELNDNDIDNDPTNDNTILPAKGEYQQSRANFDHWNLVADGYENELIQDTKFYDTNGHIFNIGTGTTDGPVAVSNYNSMEDWELAANEWNGDQLRDDGGMDTITADGEVTETFFYKIPEEKFTQLKLPRYNGQLTLFVTLDRNGLQYGYAAKQEFDKVDVAQNDYIDQLPSTDETDGDVNIHIGEGVIFYPWLEEEFFYHTRRFLGKIWYETDECPDQTVSPSSSAITTTAGEDPVEPDSPGDIDGYEYVGYGRCRDSSEESYPSVTQIYTFSAEECAGFCDKVGVDESLGLLRGYIWGGDIEGGLQVHCNCLFETGANTETIASEYGGGREHWGTMEPARFSLDGNGTGAITSTVESEYEVYCYKVGADIIEGDKTDSVCADTSGYSDQWGGTCADFEDNEGWCAGYGSMGQPGATPNENCCVCGKGAVAEDTESSISPTAAPTTSNPTLSPLATVTTLNPTPSPLAAVTTSNPTPSPTPPPSEMVAVTTQSPTTLGFGSSFGASSWPTAEEPCPEEAAAVEEACMSSMDLDNLDSYLACSLCGVEAMGEDLFNFDDFCSKWTLCVEEHCSEECKVPMNAYQNCNSMGMFDCDIDIGSGEGSGSGEDSPSATVPSPSAVAVPATQSPQGSFGSIFGSGFGASSWPTAEEPCPEEATAVEKCMPMDLNNLDSYLACSMCGLEAMGEDIFSFNVDEYCSKWTPCIEEKCPDECKVPLSEYQKCSSMGSLDCGVGSSEASRKSITTFIILAVVGAMIV